MATWNHTPPKRTQGAPRTTTPCPVLTQVGWWSRTTLRGGRVWYVHPLAAMEIAAWWSSEDATALPAFAADGTVLPGLTGEITRALLSCEPNQTEPLQALLAYVQAIER